MISTALFYLLVAVVFLVMMSVLVVAHELGHFLAARMLGMGVEEFAVGIGGKPIVTYMRRKYRTPLTDREAEEFAMGGHGADVENVVIGYGGKPLFSFWGPLPDQEEKTEYFAPNGSSEGMASKVVRGIEGGIGNVQTGELIMTPEGPALEEETAFTVRPLPLGGFVRIKGMVPEEDGSETKIPGGFYSKPPWQRLVVLFAGPLFSVLAGVLVLIPYFMIVGEQVPSPKPVLGFVGQGLAGDKAGLKAKDQIISVQDVPIYTFYQVIQLVRDRGGLETHMTVLRDGKTLFLTVVPEEDKTPTPVLGPDLKPTGEKKLQGRLGLSPKYDHKPVGFLAATRNAVEIPIESAAGLISAVTHPKDFKDSVGGPETMIRATADATSESFGKVIFLAALLSISVGIFNLLPFPPLDGGQMVMAFAEMLRGGRRLSIRAQSAVILAGLTIVAVMVMCVIVIDFQRFRSTPNSSASSTKPKEATPTK